MMLMVFLCATWFVAFLCFQGKWHILNRYGSIQKVTKEERKRATFWIDRILGGLIFVFLGCAILLFIFQMNFSDLWVKNLLDLSVLLTQITFGLYYLFLALEIIVLQIQSWIDRRKR